MEAGQQEPQGALTGVETASAPEPAAQEHIEYVVQQCTDSDVTVSAVTWIDIGRVKVPPRTRRRTVIEKALEDAPGCQPKVGEPALYRALDVASAEEIPGVLEPPEPSDPVLRIG